ncbi:hypothetical protein M427DRAFT_184471 [Gonapodya prolifera JEL478]|uniref:Uncharacterized protein n=1 Tax=Gonapodya prolifera (strain JEL478) TaxID=1344416 RepID=A0A139A0B8_GONPJ|nr:hypothetical protein M427DRAFT_184471 [Gonapodya prolifera JEL478]|eukprot:KXS10210.1 hypothetical protein M427DRAFT_184471 [Gonapodya prolifera JEL478]
MSDNDQKPSLAEIMPSKGKRTLPSERDLTGPPGKKKKLSASLHDIKPSTRVHDDVYGEKKDEQSDIGSDPDVNVSMDSALEIPPQPTPTTKKLKPHKDSSENWHKKFAKIQSRWSDSSGDSVRGLSWMNLQRHRYWRLTDPWRKLPRSIAQYKREMTRSEIDLLESLPGWSWEYDAGRSSGGGDGSQGKAGDLTKSASVSLWMRNFLAVNAFIRRHRRFPRPGALSGSDVEMKYYNWIYTQRKRVNAAETESGGGGKYGTYRGLTEDERRVLFEQPWWHEACMKKRGRTGKRKTAENGGEAGEGSNSENCGSPAKGRKSENGRRSDDLSDRQWWADFAKVDAESSDAGTDADADEDADPDAPSHEDPFDSLDLDLSGDTSDHGLHDHDDTPGSRTSILQSVNLRIPTGHGKVVNIFRERMEDTGKDAYVGSLPPADADRLLSQTDMGFKAKFLGLCEFLRSRADGDADGEHDRATPTYTYPTSATNSDLEKRLFYFLREVRISYRALNEKKVYKNVPRHISDVEITLLESLPGWNWNPRKGPPLGSKKSDYQMKFGA